MSDSDEPVGDGPYRVGTNECLDTIALENGLTVERIWNHAPNAALKGAREDPNLLREGDRLTLPEVRTKLETLATNRVHKFRKKGVPLPIQFVLLREDHDAEPEAVTPEEDESITRSLPFEKVQTVPWSHAHVRLETPQGTWETDANEDGVLELKLPQGVRAGVLLIEPDTPGEVSRPVQIARLDPVTTRSGALQRLRELGFAVRSVEHLSGALRLFQAQEGIPITGDLDTTTRDKLVAVHGN